MSVTERMLQLLESDLRALGDARLSNPDLVKHFKRLEQTTKKYLDSVQTFRQAEDKFQKQLSSDLNKIRSELKDRSLSATMPEIAQLVSTLAGIQGEPNFASRDLEKKLKQLLATDELRIGASPVVPRPSGR